MDLNEKDYERIGWFAIFGGIIASLLYARHDAKRKMRQAERHADRMIYIQEYIFPKMNI